MLTQQHLAAAMSYAQYRTLLEELMAQGKTTGYDQSEQYLDYAKMNLQRMARIEKTTVLQDSLLQKLAQLNGHYILLAITEGWCGDAAQNLPVLELLEKACPNIELKLLLRDENPTLIDQYLTNGSRSIPKVIGLEKESMKELFVWGPRPAAMQQKVLDMIAAGMPKSERGLETQKWYNNDKTHSLQNELIALIDAHMA